MGFGFDYLHCFHYPDDLGYLIFYCHTVAKILNKIWSLYFKYVTLQCMFFQSHEFSLVALRTLE